MLKWAGMHGTLLCIHAIKIRCSFMFALCIFVLTRVQTTCTVEQLGIWLTPLMPLMLRENYPCASSAMHAQSAIYDGIDILCNT